MKQPIPFDNPWERLPLILPLALLMWITGLWGIGLYLEKPQKLHLDNRPIDAQLLEIPPSAVIPTAQPKPPRPRPKVSPPLIEPQSRTLPPLKPVEQQVPAPEPPKQDARPATSPQEEVPPAPAVPASPPTPLSKGGEGARVIYRPQPKIPDELREEAFHALAVARFMVSSDGTVKVELIVPTPYPKLNQVLLETLKTWRFFPAIKDGIPIDSVQDLRIPIEVR